MKSSTVDIRIKKSGLKFVHSKVFSSVLLSKKSGLSKKSQSTLDIRIKKSGSKVSHSKVPSSGFDQFKTER